MKLSVKNKILLKTLEFLMSSLYSFFYFFIRFSSVKNIVKKRKCKYYFSICSIFKNESEILKEFIEYHKMLGTDHIYLYNNNSSDNYLQILNAYIHEGFVTLVDWEKSFAQCEAYQHCYNNVKNETFWIAFIDVDEFIVPHEAENVKSFFRRFEEYPSVVLYWKMFGTSGLIERDKNKLVIEQFTTSWKSLDGIGKFVLNTSPCFGYPVIEPHRVIAWMKTFLGRIKIPPVTEWKKFLFLPQIYEAPRKNTIQLNHYWSRSLTDYVKKISKGSAATAVNVPIRKTPQFFYMHEMKNVSEDKVIFRFLIRLKIRMFDLDPFNEKHSGQNDVK